ncbi:MAG: phage tail protein [Blastocatellia bacterium]
MRTLPAGITALISAQSTRAPCFLVEIQWPAPAGTKYYSSGEFVHWNGHDWEPNRAMSIPTFEAGLIDRKHTDFSRLQIKFDNLADNGSSSFPFTGLEGAQNLEDAKVFVHIYSPDAADGIANVWWGFTAARDFSGEEKTVTISASFYWDSLDSPLPSKQLQNIGFNPTDESGQNTEEDQAELAVPVMYGAGDMKVRPLIYRKKTEGSLLHCNFILSGCNGQAFSASDVTKNGTKLFGNTSAVDVEFLTGSSGQTAPANLSRFPDGGAHPNVAYAYAVFPITNEIKDQLDGLDSNDIKMTIANGRPLLDTGVPSENPVLILKDMLRDPNFSLGLPSSAFDATAITSAATYAGTRYQMRYELHKQRSAIDLVQYMLANFHGFVTFENGLIQIKCKRNNESSVATFATCDSGVSGRKIHNDFVDVTIKDSSELINQVTVKYRKKKRAWRAVTLYDPNAQARAGGTQKRVVEDEFDFGEDGGVYDETQAQILAAIAVREEQNGNLFIKFSTPFWDGIGIAIGDVITVKSPDIFNNGTNQTFRVTKQTIETEGEYLIHFECQIYKTAIYNDDATALGVDLLRGGDATDAQGRPPDVIPISLQILSVGTNDTEGKIATIRANFTLPAFDPATEQSDGIFRESPISEVEIWWFYDNESINQARLGVSRKVVQGTTPQNSFADFEVDYRKNRIVVAYFVAVGPNRARAPLGKIPDPTRVTTLTANLSSTGATASVAATTLFLLTEFVQIEKEILQIVSKTSNTLTFVNTAGMRTPLLDTGSIAHPSGTEVAIARDSYPALVISLAALRFNYSVIVARDIQQRGGDGLRVRWTDADPDNVEDYFVVWSSDADAGTNPAKLGVANPAWYLANPLAPPAGIKIVPASRQKHVIIPQEDIGAVGTVIFVRIFARNGKSNYSATLSATGGPSSNGLLTNSVAAGGTAPPTDAPSTPTAALVTFNQLTVGTTGEADVVLKIFASQANNALTFQAVNTTAIIAVYADPKGKEHHKHFQVKDLTATFVEIPRSWTLGGLYTWTSNIAVSGGGGKLASATAAIQIAAGGFGLAAAGITGLAITSITPINAHHSYVNYSYVQPATPVLLVAEQVLEKLAGESSFSEEKHRYVLGDTSRLVAGTITAKLKVKHPKANAAQYQIKLLSADGSSVTSSAANNTSQDDDTAAPNNGVAITIKKAKLKSGGKLLVRFLLPVTQMASHQKNVLIIHDNNSTGTGRKFYDPADSAWVTTYSDGATELDLAKGGVEGLHIKKSEIFVGGRTQFFVRIGVYNAFNGGTATYSSDIGNPITQAASEADSIGQDAAAPDLLPTPLLRFKRGKLVAKMNMDTVANVQTLKNRVDLCVYDGSNSLNLDDPTSEVIVAGLVFYQVSEPHKTLPFDLDQLKRMFGAGASLRCRFRLTNDVAPTTSGDSNLLPLSTQKDTTTLYNPVNMLRNGHFVMNDGTVAKHWQPYNPNNGNFGTLDQTGKLRLDKPEHRAKWRDTNNQNDQRFLTQNLGKTFFKNEFFSFSWNVYSNGTPTIDEFVIGLYTQKTLTNTISGSAGGNLVNGSGFVTDGVKVGSVIGNGTEWRTVTAVTATQLTVDRNWSANFSGTSGFALIPQATRLPQTNLALTTADRYQKGTVFTDTDLDTSRDVYFVVVLRDVVDTTTFPFVDALCMNAGQESGGYQRSVASFETNFANTGENFDSQPTGGSSSGGAQPPGGGSGGPGVILPIVN